MRCVPKSAVRNRPHYLAEWGGLATLAHFSLDFARRAKSGMAISSQIKSKVRQLASSVRSQTSNSMTPLQKPAEVQLARRQARRRRVYRRLRQFNLLSLLLLTAVAGILRVVGPPIFELLTLRVEQMSVRFELRHEAMVRLKSRRPAATAYRNERFTTKDNGYLLRGECLIGGVWHRYWLGDGRPTLTAPLSE